MRHVAVVGAGPSGLFAAQELVEDDRVVVDVLERLPTPFGLVRYGVAPDHPRIKSVTDSFSDVLQHPRVRFLGDVEFGVAPGRRELLSAYDAVVYATGAAGERLLGISNDDALGTTSARDLVAWYSAHPDAVPGRTVDAEHVVVAGGGNVSLDVARILLAPTERLLNTDMPEHVLSGLHTSAPRTVTIVCRRPPHQTKFSLKELRELATVDGLHVSVDPGDLDGIDTANLSRTEQRVLEQFREWSASGEQGTHLLRFAFARSITAIGLTNGRVSRVEVDHHAGATHRRENLTCDLLVRAIGYRGQPLPDVPFDEELGIIPNVEGRVLNTQSGAVNPGEYVVGWAKRGPSGVIGTNKADAAETVAHLLSDLPVDGTRRPDLATTLLEHAVDYRRWCAIDDAEIALGSRANRDRIKLHTWTDLRRAAFGNVLNESEVIKWPSQSAATAST
ncbi:FAD-dependent oxidoreductase [Microbacterium sp. A84]|uniref:FAD-dependent oxidoreductase n=1 Tax=Microbacterium sp. A84 TaxID=3450715 RepID=UPI003F43E45A